MKPKKKMKIILVAILFLCVFVAFLLSPLFNFRSISITGAEFYQAEELQNSLNYLVGKNYFIALFENTPFSHLDYIFRGRLYDVEQQLMFDKPYLKFAEISFSFPGVAEVLVEERSPAFLAKNGDEYLLIDSEGYVLEAFSAEEKPGYPIVEGVETAGFKVGNTLAGRGTDLQLELAIKICNGMSQIQFSDEAVNIVDVSDTDRVWLFVKPSLSICIGSEDDLGIKLSVLKEILASGYDGNSNGVIDFTNGKNPIFKENSDTEQDSQLEQGTDPVVEVGEDFLDENLLADDLEQE